MALAAVSLLWVVRVLLLRVVGSRSELLSWVVWLLLWVVRLLRVAHGWRCISTDRLWGKSSRGWGRITTGDRGRGSLTGVRLSRIGCSTTGASCNNKHAPVHNDAHDHTLVIKSVMLAKITQHHMHICTRVCWMCR